MILYQGLLRSPASWARVGRGYVKALLASGVEVAAVSTRGFRYDPHFPLPSGLREYTPREAKQILDVETGLGFLHPPHADRLVGKRRFNCFVWEADRVPADWVEALDRHAHSVLVPSSFTHRALVTSGFPDERIAVVPYGYDHTVIEGVAPTPVRSAGSHTILAVLAPHFRKGVEELLAAYRDAFVASDDVVLRIKTTYDPGESRRRFPFEIPSWREMLRRSGLDAAGAPRVTVDVRTLNDGEILQLYGEARVVAQPSWGEAFGLAMLEALALGRPVLATGWGGQCDFLPLGKDRLPYRLEKAGDRLYAPVEGARCARADVSALAERMRWHYENPAASRRLGDSARQHVAPWTWEAAARRLREVLEGDAHESK